MAVPKPAQSPTFPQRAGLYKEEVGNTSIDPYFCLIVRLGRTGAGRYVGVEAQPEEQTHPALTKDRCHFKE